MKGGGGELSRVEGLGLEKSGMECVGEDGEWKRREKGGKGRGKERRGKRRSGEAGKGGRVQGGGVGGKDKEGEAGTVEGEREKVG